MARIAMAGEQAPVTPAAAAIGEAKRTPVDTAIAAAKATTADAAMAEGSVMRTHTALATTMGLATAAGTFEGLTVTTMDITAPRMHTGTLTRPATVIRPVTMTTGAAGFRVPAALCLTLTNSVLVAHDRP